MNRKSLLDENAIYEFQLKIYKIMILVFIEHKDCQLNKASLEAIAAAQGIGKDLNLKVTAVIPCDKDCALAQEIAQYDI